MAALQSAALGLPARRCFLCGGEAKACAILEIAMPGVSGERHGVAIDANIVTASVLAMLAGVNRQLSAQAVRKAA